MDESGRKPNGWIYEYSDNCAEDCPHIYEALSF